MDANWVTSILLLNRPSILLPGFILGLLLDAIYPLHRGILLKLHPVHTCYIYSKKLYRPYAGYLWGVLNAGSCIIIHVLPPVLLLYVSSVLPKPYSLITSIIVIAVIVKVSMGITLLFTSVRNVGHKLSNGDEMRARRYVQGLVRRNVYTLDIPHVLSATIESFSESLVDGYVSPLTYFFMLGPLGGLLQRLSNTLDGSLGFKGPPMVKQGWFSAKLDTLMNYLPARITGILILLVSKLMKHSKIYELNTLRRMASLLESVNAGWPIGAMAIALGVKLEKPGNYSIGIGELPHLRHLFQALKIGFLVILGYTCLAVFLYMVVAKIFIGV
ncbi:MAG: cobalamin biosynthesis protein [Desulfurococcales archaeon]|nr:cobalamin biosynthesis protein [Desulfurococcales archaeon]